MRGGKRSWLVAMLAFGLPAWGQQPALCLVESVRLDQATRASFRAELAALAPEWKFVGCEVGSVRVYVRWGGGAKFPGALGVTAVAGARVLPVIEVYVGSIARHIGEPPTAIALGKALARVAAHELTHYRLQKLTHDREGLMRAEFGPRQLLLDGAVWAIGRNKN